MLKKLFSYLACALLVVMSFSSCKKDEPNQAVALFGGTEWRGKTDIDTSLDKETYYFVCHFYKDGTFRMSKADQGGMIFEEEATGTYKYDAPHIKIRSSRGNYVFTYSTSPRESIHAAGFDVRMYKQ